MKIPGARLEMARMQKEGLVIFLDEDGKETNSFDLAKRIRLTDKGRKEADDNERTKAQ